MVGLGSSSIQNRPSVHGSDFWWPMAQFASLECWCWMHESCTINWSIFHFLFSIDDWLKASLSCSTENHSPSWIQFFFLLWKIKFKSTLFFFMFLQMYPTKCIWVAEDQTHFSFYHEIFFYIKPMVGKWNFQLEFNISEFF